MWRATWKSALARRLRLVLTATAVLLGVTFVTGTLVLTETTNERFRDLFADATAGVDVVVRTAVAFDSAMGVEVTREQIGAAVVDRIRDVDGVAGAEGLLRGAQVEQRDGRPRQALPVAETGRTHDGVRPRVTRGVLDRDPRPEAQALVACGRRVDDDLVRARREATVPDPERAVRYGHPRQRHR